MTVSTDLFAMAAPACPECPQSIQRVEQTWDQAARWPGPDDHPGYRQAIAERMLAEGPGPIRERVREWLQWLFAGSLTLDIPRDWSDWDEVRRI